MVLAINRVADYLRGLNRSLSGVRSVQGSTNTSGDSDYRLIMTIHDELDFDFPKHPRNQKVITDIARLMAQSGDDIGVPTPVEVSRHSKDWSQDEKVSL